MSRSDTTTAVRPSLASFWSDLPREGKWLLSTVIVDFVGTGMVLPFSVVYLHEVRHFDLSQVGVLLAIPAVVGLAVVGPAGAVIDRVGARAAFIVAICAQIVAAVLLATADTSPRAAGALAVQGFAGGIVWPAVSTLIAVIVPSRLRQRYFGINFTLLNLGIGIGGLVGGFLVDVQRPGTFVAIYLIDAVSYLAPLAVVLGPLRHVGRGVRPPAKPAGDQSSDVTALAPPQPGGYRFLLRDRALLPVLLIGLVATFVGYGQLTAGVPAYARAEAGISTQTLGLAFTANTVVIVVFQLLVLQRVEGRRRTRLIVIMAALWAVSYGALGLAGVAGGGPVAAALFVASLSIFGLGETFFQPTLPAMVNDLAPDHLRGRYNAASSMCFQASAVLGPIVAAALVDRGLSSAYVGLLIAGCAAVAALALAIERRLPPAVNGLFPPAAAVRPGGAGEPGTVSASTGGHLD